MKWRLKIGIGPRGLAVKNTLHTVIHLQIHALLSHLFSIFSIYVTQTARVLSQSKTKNEDTSSLHEKSIITGMSISETKVGK